MDFSIITFTLNRKHYLRKTIDSIKKQANGYCGKIHHHLFFQGVNIDDETKKYIYENAPDNYLPVVHEWHKNVGISDGTNIAIKQINTNYVFKIDEDILLVTDNFFQHFKEIILFEPNAFIAPFPIGLIVWCGGPKPISYHVKYSDVMDTYYTFRKVNVTGGGCRVMPTHVLRQFLPLTNDLSSGNSGSDDDQLTIMCNKHNVPIYYMENSVAFEHQESCIGQRERFSEYYKSRNDRYIVYPYPKKMQIKLYVRELARLLGLGYLIDKLDQWRGRSIYRGWMHRM